MAIGGGSLVPSCRRRSPGSAWRRDGARGRPADGTRRRHDHQPSPPERGVAGREEREGADAWRDGGRGRGGATEVVARLAPPLSRPPFHRPLPGVLASAMASALPRYRPSRALPLLGSRALPLRGGRTCRLGSGGGGGPVQGDSQGRDGAQAQGTRQAPDIHSRVYEYESINWESWTRASLHLANINRSLNGIGKSTALKVLAGKLKPNLGRFKNPPDWQEILTYFRGSELQNYFTRLLEDNLKVQGTVVGVIQWGKIMQRVCK